MGWATRMGHGYGLLQARVWVGNFPPTKNPYLQGGLPGLTRVFFHVQCTLSLVPPVPPLHSLSSAAADNYNQVTIAALPANSLLSAPSRRWRHHQPIYRHQPMQLTPVAARPSPSHFLPSSSKFINRRQAASHELAQLIGHPGHLATFASLLALQLQLPIQTYSESLYLMSLSTLTDGAPSWAVARGPIL